MFVSKPVEQNSIPEPMVKGESRLPNLSSDFHMHEVAGTHVALDITHMHRQTHRHTNTSNKMKLEKRRTEANKQGRNYRNNNNKNRFKTRIPEFLLSLNGTSWEIQWDIPEITETNKQTKTDKWLHSQILEA